MKRLLLLWLEFVALSIPLLWAWIEWGRPLYARVLFALTAPVLAALSIPHASRGPTATRLLGYVPFLVLMLITPALSARRRVLGTLVGFALIFASHFGLALMVDYAYATQSRNSRAVATLFPALLAVDALPFLIWAVLASGFIRSLFAPPRK